MGSDVDDTQLLRHFNSLKTMIKDSEEQKIVEYIKQNNVTPNQFRRTAAAGGSYFPCPVCVAAKTGRLDVMNVLISMGFPYQDGSPDDRGLNMSPVHLAAYGGHLEIVRCLISTHGVDIESRDSYDNTPLYWAINKSRINMDLVKYLLERGAVVNERNKIDNSSLLHISVRRFGNKDVCECLLSHGADVNAGDHQGNTPLHDAALWGHEGSVRSLLVAGADVNARTRSDDTPFLVASKFNVFIVLKLLQANGADPEAYNKDKDTALHFAVMKRSYEIVQYLTVELNVKPDTPNTVNVTPLWLAICQGDVDIVNLLIQCGCQPKPPSAQRERINDVAINFSPGVAQKEREIIVSVVKEAMSRSRPLQDLCIFNIRRELGRRLISAVDLLPLPLVIKDLVKLCHLSQIGEH